MLFGLSGGGCFRAVAGLEASLKLASSGLVAILSATMRVYYPDNIAMVRKNGSRLCLSKRELPQRGSNSIVLCEDRRNIWPNMVTRGLTYSPTCRISNASQIMTSPSASREARFTRHRSASRPSSSREVIGMPARSHPTPTQAYPIELPLWEIPWDSTALSYH